MNMDYMLNPDKYHIPPPRLDGEKDEQYKLRLRAYSMGQQSQQAKIDELQARVDKALERNRKWNNWKFIFYCLVYPVGIALCLIMAMIFKWLGH